MARTLVLLIVVLASCNSLAAANPPDSAVESPACEQIAALIDESAALSLSPRVERAFALTLLAADNAVHQGQQSKALTLLRTFIFEVRGVKRAHRLRADAADGLVARAEEAISALSF